MREEDEDEDEEEEGELGGTFGRFYNVFFFVLGLDVEEDGRKGVVSVKAKGWRLVIPLEKAEVTRDRY